MNYRKNLCMLDGKYLRKYIYRERLKSKKLKLKCFFRCNYIFCSLQKQQFDMNEKNKKLQKKLEEILPECIKDITDSPKNDLQNILGELEKLKSYLNNVELQLYEANEHVSDLEQKVSFHSFQMVL